MNGWTSHALLTPSCMHTHVLQRLNTQQPSNPLPSLAPSDSLRAAWGPTGAGHTHAHQVVRGLAGKYGWQRL